MKKAHRPQEDAENYRKMASVTYIIQIFQGLKVTDMNGSIPYTQASNT